MNYRDRKDNLPKCDICGADHYIPSSKIQEDWVDGMILFKCGRWHYDGYPDNIFDDCNPHFEIIIKDLVYEMESDDY